MTKTDCCIWEGSFRYYYSQK